MPSRLFSVPQLGSPAPTWRIVGSSGLCPSLARGAPCAAQTVSWAVVPPPAHATAHGVPHTPCHTRTHHVELIYIYIRQVERAIDDGINVVKSMTKDARFVPGAGAVELRLADALQQCATSAIPHRRAAAPPHRRATAPPRHRATSAPPHRRTTALYPSVPPLCTRPSPLHPVCAPICTPLHPLCTPPPLCHSCRTPPTPPVPARRPLCAPPLTTPPPDHASPSLRLRYGEAQPGLDQYAINKFGLALEVVPRTLAENAGIDAAETIAAMYKAHKGGAGGVGIDITELKAGDCGVLDLLATKKEALKLAAEAAITVLRVDSIIMAKPAGGPKAPEQ